MCQFETSWENKANYFDEIPVIIAQLQEMEKDKLLKIVSNGILVTETGKPFIRNICMAFDLRLQRNIPETQLFSMTI